LALFISEQRDAGSIGGVRFQPEGAVRQSGLEHYACDRFHTDPSANELRVFEVTVALCGHGGNTISSVDLHLEVHHTGIGEYGVTHNSEHAGVLERPM